MDLATTIADLAGRRGVELILETSGVAGGDALSILGKWGRACFIGLPGEVHFRTEEQYKKQWTIMTSWTMSTIQQRRCAEFVVEHGLPIDDLYTHSWSLDQAAEAYECSTSNPTARGSSNSDTRPGHRINDNLGRTGRPRPFRPAAGREENEC